MGLHDLLMFAQHFGYLLISLIFRYSAGSPLSTRCTSTCAPLPNIGWPSFVIITPWAVRRLQSPRCPFTPRVTSPALCPLLTLLPLQTHRTPSCYGWNMFLRAPARAHPWAPPCEMLEWQDVNAELWATLLRTRWCNNEDGALTGGVAECPRPDLCAAYQTWCKVRASHSSLEWFTVFT